MLENTEGQSKMDNPILKIYALNSTAELQIK
jgi:hypothetical protein